MGCGNSEKKNEEIVRFGVKKAESERGYHKVFLSYGKIYRLKITPMLSRQKR